MATHTDLGSQPPPQRRTLGFRPGAGGFGSGLLGLATSLGIGGFAQMAVDELGERDLFGEAEAGRRVQRDDGFTGVIAPQLHGHGLAAADTITGITATGNTRPGNTTTGEGAEFGGITPEVLQLEDAGVLQAHHQGGMDVIEPAAPGEAHEGGRQGPPA